MKKTGLICLLLLMGLALRAQETRSHSHSEILMGSAFGFTVVHEDDTLAWKAIHAGIAEIRRIENLISSWKPTSQTSEINRNAGIKPVQVDPELYQLIARGQKISRLTNGAFDLSFASIDKLWRFDGSMTQVPEEATVATSVARIGYEKIVLDPEESTVFLPEKGMKIGFGGIGKGYAANRAAKVMQEMGINSGLVNAGGDLLTFGTEADGKPWKVGISDPQDAEKLAAWLEVSDLAVVTSGDYERFALIDGHRYAHIIDPRTGWPAEGLRSVTILCPDAELADALATGVFVLGPDKGLALVNKLVGIECVLVTREGKLLQSKNLNLKNWSRDADQEKQWQLKIGEK